MQFDFDWDSVIKLIVLYWATIGALQLVTKRAYVHGVQQIAEYLQQWTPLLIQIVQHHLNNEGDVDVTCGVSPVGSNHGHVPSTTEQVNQVDAEVD
jgi:hypothetical protein